MFLTRIRFPPRVSIAEIFRHYIYNRRQSITNELFDKLVKNSDHKLHNLLPPVNHTLFLRSSLKFRPPLYVNRTDSKHFYYEKFYKYTAFFSLLQ